MIRFLWFYRFLPSWLINLGKESKMANLDILLGIDIGTYESKGVLVTRDGQVLASASIGHELSLPRPGWAEHDADGVWWHDFVHLSRKLLTDSAIDPARVAAVGCSSIGQCVLPIDAAGRPLRPGILYGIDSRCTAEIGEIERMFGQDVINANIGRVMSTQDLGPRLLWLKKNEPEVWKKTAAVLSSTSYLVYRLTGEKVMDIYTATDSGPMFSIHDLEYKPALTEPFLPVDSLPHPLWSTDLAGRVTPQAAAETGLRPGTPVIAGTTDAGSEALSAGLGQVDDLMIMYGSTIFFVQKTERLVTDGLMWAAPYLAPGTFVLAAGMSSGGSLTRWFRDQFAPLEMAQEKDGGLPAYAALAHLAEQSVPGAKGLLALPYFYGERHPINDPRARGVIAGLTLSHTRADIYRAMLEAVGYGIRHVIETINGLGIPPLRCLAVGGGTRNPLWLQIVSDITGQEQLVPRENIGASYGDAFLAGMGIGWFSGLEDIQGWVRYREPVRPDPSRRELYDRYYALYRRLYLETAATQHALADLQQEAAN
jgi:xylulokinase